MAFTDKYVSAAGSGTKDGSSAANAYGWTEFRAAMTGGAAAAGDRYNLLKGAIGTGAASDSWTNSGTVANPIIIRGYNATIGDLDIPTWVPAQADLDDTNFPIVTYTGVTRLNITTATNLIFQNISFVGTASSAMVDAGTNFIFRNCKFRNVNNGSGSSALSCLSGTNVKVAFCDMKQTGTTPRAATVSGQSTHYNNCRVNATTIGIDATSGDTIIVRSTIYGCPTAGIAGTGSSTGRIGYYDGNSIYGCGNGIQWGNFAYNFGMTAINSLLVGNTTAINSLRSGTTDLVIYLSNNGYFNNGTKFTGYAQWALGTDFESLDLAADPFVNAAGNDFRLLRTSAAAQAGMPVYVDMGAYELSRPTIAS